MNHDTGREASTVADTRTVPLRTLLTRTRVGAGSDAPARVTGEGGPGVLPKAAFTSAI